MNISIYTHYEKNVLENKNVASGFLNSFVSCLNQMKDPNHHWKPVHLGSQLQPNTVLFASSVGVHHWEMNCLPATNATGLS